MLLLSRIDSIQNLNRMQVLLENIEVPLLSFRRAVHISRGPLKT